MFILVCVLLGSYFILFFWDRFSPSNSEDKRLTVLFRFLLTLWSYFIVRWGLWSLLSSQCKSGSSFKSNIFLWLLDFFPPIFGFWPCYHLVPIIYCVVLFFCPTYSPWDLWRFLNQLFDVFLQFRKVLSYYHFRICCRLIMYLLSLCFGAPLIMLSLCIIYISFCLLYHFISIGFTENIPGI